MTETGYGHVEYEVVVGDCIVAVAASINGAQRRVDHLHRQGEVAHYRPRHRSLNQINGRQ